VSKADAKVVRGHDPMTRTPNCESDRCFNGCRAKQTPEHLLMSCRTYKLERQSMIRITKQYKDEPGPLKFAHLFKNATIVDKILKFLEKIEIATRDWLQNQDRMKEKEGIKEEEE
jgi:hypothetical protein